MANSANDYKIALIYSEIREGLVREKEQKLIKCFVST